MSAQNRGARIRRVLSASALCVAASASAALAFDPAVEGQNFAKTSERYAYVVGTPEFQARLQQQNVQDNADLAQIAAREAPAGADARNFTGNVCFQHKQECAGDVRFYDWAANGFGIRQEVMFGGRSGATISGNVWATRAGPPKRPLIVLTSGSVQAPEQLYWGLAAVLAKHGYVVLTYDVQGQGRSDTFGEGADMQEGVPSQAGQPFYDGTEDALDFMLSTPSAPYDPRPSCGNANGGVGTDHSPKHSRRVAAGLNDTHNPYWERVDPSRVGLAGHSLGAAAVSYVGQLDPRVDAVVAWDNLRDTSSGSNGTGCPSGASPRPATVPLTKPSLGMSNDYGIVATPNGSDPDPQKANTAFAAFKGAGVDSMQVNRRGGTHFEYSFIPGQTAPPLGLATLRGMDMTAWYTVAWFDKYVACGSDLGCEREADRRLLTDRWRNDLREQQVDAAGDPNLYSFYLRSRFDITDADGAERTCDDMRSGCATMAPDGLPPGYDFVADANRIDDPAGGGGGGGGGGGDEPPACTLGQRGSDFDDSPETLPGTDAGDAIRAGGGNDRLRGGRGDDCLYGEAGKDDVGGDEDDDTVDGGDGRDRLLGGDGRDRLRGGPGADRLGGGADADRLIGGGGSDRLRDAKGRDSIRGGGGNDRIDVRGGGRQRVSCGKGTDAVRADPRDRVGKSCEKVAIR